MIELNWKQTILPPYKHQRVGTARLVQRPRYGLFWEMRVGKTKAVIDAACFLHQAGQLKNLVIVCPAQVVDVWANKAIGEVKKHAFVPTMVKVFDSTTADYMDMLTGASADLNIILMSQELLRQEDRKSDFPRVYEMDRAAHGAWIVHDEASAFGNHKSLQTKSALHLSKILRPERLTLLDGTPIGNSPIEQYSKFKLLKDDLLGYTSFFHFRAVHQVAEPSKYAKRGKKFVGFQNQDRIDRKVKDHCWYLEQKDCLDMPETVTQFLTVSLTPKSWRQYCEMRDEMVAELDCGVLSAQHASVKVMRLCQMCAGFAGGLQNEETLEVETKEISDETCVETVKWAKRKLEERPDFKCVVWARFRPEIERLYHRLIRNTSANVRMVYGSKKLYHDELHPDNPHVGSLILVAQPQAMRFGVNCSKADVQVFLSQDYNRITRSQAEARIKAPKVPGSARVNLAVDVLVTGPNGQRTVTWDVKACLDGKDEVARRTAGEWKQVLLREDQ